MINKTLTRSLLLIFAAVLFTACSLSTEQLAEEVKKDMTNSAEFKERQITVQEFTLVHKAGNEYNGLLKTKEPNGEFTYTVEVVYDGESFTWKVLEQVNK
ncbi:MAG: hypothetical protein IPI12_09510 [Ignavibacteriales bacterium]|jgi:hypothetical protein|nr:hypothetical protein [Ignavibacteriales bacterium]MBK7266552.1 hypothetical protein [Ignavibacteriales bacterium]MBP9123116.1 hypothetical protein [Ignavibacteriaceae bacterium]MCC6637856.1 hypothetical protein [Ignavibacteriaceae bacterium]